MAAKRQTRQADDSDNQREMRTGEQSVLAVANNTLLDRNIDYSNTRLQATTAFEKVGLTLVRMLNSRCN